jgi:catechol 2,3-dioxygenase-like lactoylglutathione lyase family enzyme
VINGAHVVLYSTDPDADRTFLSDVLGLPHVDAGGGWLIFALPPSEVAVHPADGTESHELFLMCEDIDATVHDLTAKGVEFTETVSDQRWGRLARLRLPSGAQLRLYEPRHLRPAQP